MISGRTLKTPLRWLKLRLACWAPGVACSECAGCDVACPVVCRVSYVKLRLLSHYREHFSHLSTVDSLHWIPSLFFLLSPSLSPLFLSLFPSVFPHVCVITNGLRLKRKKRNRSKYVRIPKERYPSQPTPNDTLPPTRTHYINLYASTISMTSTAYGGRFKCRSRGGWDFSFGAQQ